MEIRKPLTNIVSVPVKNWKEIKEEAIELKEFLDNKNFTGNWNDAFAISHTQVSTTPKNFFVVHKKFSKSFGSRYVINAKIIAQSDPCTYPEGCMSFMFREVKRVKRFIKVTVRYQIPFLNLFLISKIKQFNGSKQVEAFIVAHETDHACGRNIYGL